MRNDPKKEEQSVKHARIRAALSLAVNAGILVLTAFIVFGMLFFAERPDDPTVNTRALRYYTTLSNILAALVAVPMSVCAACALIRVVFAVPRWLSLLRFIATSALTLTMMTVLLFLGPVFGFDGMFSGPNFWFHLVNPVLSVFAFLFLEKEADYPAKNPLPGIVQTAVYGAVYVYMVVLLGEGRGGWPDFYGFNFGGFWYLTVAMLLFGNLIFAKLLLFARERLNSPKKAERG